MSGSLAIITARGGSKRIPRKNIRAFLGKPIIAYSVSAALGSGCFDEVMISTDDKEIAEVGVSYGAKVPFMRSPENASDFAGTAEVLKEVVLEYQKRGRVFDFLCCIYPTAPFVTPAKLKNGMALLRQSGADCVLPIVAFSHPIQRALKIVEGRALMFWPENYPKRTQDLISAYHDSGQFYCLKITSLLEQMRLFPAHTVPIITPESEVQDIDNEEDWKLAEMKFQLLNCSSRTSQ